MFFLGNHKQNIATMLLTLSKLLLYFLKSKQKNDHMQFFLQGDYVWSTKK